MSYLLTEIAMDMLGWRFYDADGVARPLNFEGANNAVCEGVENLAVSLGIQPSSSKTNIASQVPVSVTEIIDLDVDSPVESDDEHAVRSSENKQDHGIGDVPDLANINDLSVSGQQDGETPHIVSANISNASGTPLALKIQNVQGGYNTTTVGTSVGDDTRVETSKTAHLLHPSNTLFESPNSIPHVIDLTEDDVGPKFDMDIEKQLETEIENISQEMVRQKTIFFQAIPEILKHPLSTFQGVLKSYREQEIKNLEDVLKSLQDLRGETELETYAIFKDNYIKYLNIFNELNARTQTVKSAPSESNVNVGTTVATTPKGRKQIVRKKTSP